MRSDLTSPVTEEELKAHSKAARVTEDMVNDNIIHEAYINAGHVYESMGVNPKNIPPSLYLLTTCYLTLANGFVIVGFSSCASPDNYDEEIGQRLARKHAFGQIWPLMGYNLREELLRSEAGIETND